MANFKSRLVSAFYKRFLHRLTSMPFPLEVRTGICGSDISYYNKFANGDICACAPLSLGHESSGVVIAVGPNVSNFKIGDRVPLEVGIPCGECGICRKGRYNLCKRMRFRSSAKSVPHFQGTLQERINYPAKWCHRYSFHFEVRVENSKADSILESQTISHLTRLLSLNRSLWPSTP
jgi:D-arabinose 1-dehydrogenase-like Zn-dependent alcohol dehydrogenase